MRYLIAFLMLCGLSQAATVLISQSGGTVTCQGSSQSTISISTFNAGSQVAGNTYVLCGAITTAVSISSSGTSGSKITMLWDTGARVSLASGHMFEMNGNSWWVFDGGIACGPGTACDTVEAANPTGYATGQAGIIEATANGSGLANQSSDTKAFASTASSHDNEIKNLIVRNLYRHTSSSDNTSSVDTGDLVYQCPFTTGCASGTLSLHDSDFHDMGMTFSMERGSTTTVKIFNNDIWRNNWAMENSGNGTRTIYFYNNHIHDTTNWDTGVTDSFHHNGLHNFMNVESDSLGLYFYNNTSDGDWGACCTTALQVFTETAHPANFYFFNNVAIQNCNNNTAPGFDYGGITSNVGPHVYNNTYVGCASTSANVRAFDVSGTSVVTENNADQGFGQFVVVNTGATLTAFDYNSYGAIGISGNNPWQCASTSAATFANWKATSCSPDAHGQKVSSLGLNSSGVPQTGAAVISAALNLNSVCNGQANPGLGALCFDVNGVARPTVAAWDAGAFQFGPSFTVSPTTVPANHGGSITLTLTGTGTAWNGSTAFSVSGVSGTALSSCSNTTATAETCSITTGAGTGTATLTDTTDSISSTFQVAQAATPTCDHATGTYFGSFSNHCSTVTTGTVILCWATGATIPATNGDGATCSVGTPLANNGSTTISVSETFNIIAGVNGGQDSAVQTYVYTVSAQIQSGTISNGAQISNGAVIR